MNIIHKHVKDLTAVEYRACYKANYGAGGYMQEEVARCRVNGYPGEVIMLWDGPDHSTASLIGWALLTPVRLYGLVGVTRWVMQRSKYTAQFWVKKKYRRQGHGKTLMDEVKKYDSNPHVIPHNAASSELFSSYNVQVLQSDKGWMRKKPKVS